MMIAKEMIERGASVRQVTHQPTVDESTLRYQLGDPLDVTALRLVRNNDRLTARRTSSARAALQISMVRGAGLGTSCEHLVGPRVAAWSHLGSLKQLRLKLVFESSIDPLYGD